MLLLETAQVIISVNGTFALFFCKLSPLLSMSGVSRRPRRGICGSVPDADGVNSFNGLIMIIVRAAFVCRLADIYLRYFKPPPVMRSLGGKGGDGVRLDRRSISGDSLSLGR
ncbi:hypothetical protein AVEN_234387-1 [Araneus ventricosus]|uniref:Uncharacterized protein n=1 Tax=Araneus ventricosus TaxID=182803 RepID=A0A4Y2A9T6_ARAVE|nr:hypothetical protein AVEN_234387-1 [Araneus ventricosus]